MEPDLRRADAADTRAVADLWLRARKAAGPAVPPPVHSDDEVRGWFERTVLPKMDVWLATTPTGEIAGLLVLDEGCVEQLYVDPALTGQGIGTRLLELAKRRSPTGLELWTFQSNERARRFYERHGFTELRRTDGDNEEGAPDVLLAWRPRP